MRVAILSGKGGTGKTFLSVNLANVAKNATYMDCDVEEPNGRLFLKPTNTREVPVYTKMPTFDNNKCIGCRECVHFCHFNAIVYVQNKIKLFPEVCHACGGCALVCEAKAISETSRQVGIVEEGEFGHVRVVTGVLNLGEASAIPVIKRVLEIGKEEREKEIIEIIDCPPGSSCSAMESVSEADYCMLVVEPTSFGFHNFKMVYELVTLMQKPCGIIINKSDQEYMPLRYYCTEQNIPILLEIPYQDTFAKLSASGRLVTEYSAELFEQFENLLRYLEEEAT